MSSGITTAFWSMTINNYDDVDLAMVQNGYPDYLREIVHTLEKGEEGTPHIQAWIKLQRQQRLSFVKKLFPRGHFRPLTSDEYIHNTKRYAQKLDATAQSAAVHVFHDPVRTVESVMKEVCLEIKPFFDYDEFTNKLLLDYRYMVEKRFVHRDFRYAKIFVSTVYRKMWDEFGPSIYDNIVHTHTHTHKDEKFSQQDGINNAVQSSHSPRHSSHSGSRRSSVSSYYDDGSQDSDDLSQSGST